MRMPGKPPPSKFEPMLVTVVWDDPRSTHDSFTLDDVLRGRGVGLYRERKTSGRLCYFNEEYLEVYGDYDSYEEPVEVGGGTGILWVLVKRIHKGEKGTVIYRAST